MSSRPIVAVLGRGVVPADEPVLRADDPGILGDGLFETMHVRAGRPWLVEQHLARLERSARLVEQPLPPTAKLVGLLRTVCTPWPPTDEGSLRLVCTRGPAGAGPTAVATLSPVPADVIRGRRTGVAAVTRPLGVAAASRAAAPWQLAGVKSSSYGLSLAGRRWAARTGVDELLWTSIEGHVLEAPTANVVWLDGKTLCTVPASTTGILPGVTAAWLLRQATTLGFTAAERMVTPSGLRNADGVWLTSSVRGLAEVRSLDGHPLPPSPHTPALRALLGLPH